MKKQLPCWRDRTGKGRGGEETEEWRSEISCPQACSSSESPQFVFLLSSGQVRHLFLQLDTLQYYILLRIQSTGHDQDLNYEPVAKPCMWTTASSCLLCQEEEKNLYTSYSHKNAIPSNKWGCNYLAQPNRFQACGNCLLSAISSKCMQEDYVCGLAGWRIYPQQELQGMRGKTSGIDVVAGPDSHTSQF